MLVFMCSRSSAGTNRFGRPAANIPPGAMTSSPTSSLNHDALQQLERLASLKASGAIDETEFQRMKAGIMPSASA